MMQKQTVAVAAPQETDYSLIFAPPSPLPQSGGFGLVVRDSDFEKTKDFLTSDLDRRKCYKKKKIKSGKRGVTYCCDGYVRF